MNHTTILRRVAVAVVPAIALVIHACTQPLTLEDVLVKPTSMAAVGSTSITAAAGAVVANPVKVLVKDQDQAPLANQSVTFDFSKGAPSSVSATTNDQGQAGPATWTAPTQAGPATITAHVLPEFGVPNVVFNVTVNAGAPATQSAATGTTPQSAIAGQPVGTPPDVRVVDQFANGVQGVVVTFTVLTGGGTVNGASLSTINVTTDANGSAKLTSWVLGPAVGTNNNTLRATTSVLPGQPVTFTATGTVGPINKIVIAPPGNSQGQTAVAGSNVTNAPSVLVTDANNNPISGASALFTIALGAGKVLANSGDATGANSLQVTTNASGIATIFGWRLGTLGANSLTVTSPGATGVTFTITATATAGPPATIAVVTETPSSNAQTDTVGSTVTVAPGAVVRDANSNVVASTSVTFTVGASSGTIKTSAGGAEVATGTVTTDANGVARLFSWKLGNRGANTLTAAVTANTSITVGFTATGIAGAPTSIEIVPAEVSSWSSNSTIASTATTPAPGVLVKDANGLTVEAGNNISFTITAGVGVVSATGCAGTATSATVATDANGVARVGCWKPGTVGANQLRAVVVGTPALLVNFNSTGTVGPPTQITFTNLPWPFTQASTTNGGVPKVTVRDAANNAVSGLTINWSNALNANSTVGGTTTSTTDASGVAQFGGAQGGTWTAAAVASGNAMALQATVSGATSVNVITNSTVVGVPNSVALMRATPTSATVNSIVAPAPFVNVRDAPGRPVPKSPISWTITANPGGTSGATLTGAYTLTDSLGEAYPGAWKLASTAGANSIQAAISSPVSAISFTTTGVAGTAANIGVNTGNGQTASVSTAVATPPSVVVRDAFGNLAGSGVSVTFQPVSGSGSVTGSPTTTNVSSIATVGSWTLGSTGGTHTLNAFLTASPGVTTSFSATATDPCGSGSTPHTIGATVNGTLAASDCNLLNEGGSGTKYGDVFRITAGATTRFRAQLSSGVFGPQIRSYVYADGSYWYNGTSATPQTITSYYVVGAGTHDIVATSFNNTTTGAYTFLTELNPAMPSGCGDFVVTKNISVAAHTLVTPANCPYTYNGGSSAVSSRRYLLYLPAGQPAVVRVSGATVDWFLEAKETSGTFIVNRDVGFAGDPEVMTITSAASDRFIEIRVTHYTGNIPAAGTYPYTFVIDP